MVNKHLDGRTILLTPSMYYTTKATQVLNLLVVEQYLVVRSYHIGEAGKAMGEMLQFGEQTINEVLVPAVVEMLQLKFTSQDTRMWSEQHGSYHLPKSSDIFRCGYYIALLLFAGTSGIQGEMEHRNPSLASALPPLCHDRCQWHGQLNRFSIC